MPANPHGQGFIAATSWKRAGKDRRPAHPRDRDPTVLHRLAERLEDITAEFRQLVEEEDALVRQGDFAGRQVRAAADHPGIRHGVVRCPERRSAAQLVDRPLAGGRRHDRRRQRGRVVERRQQARDRPRQQGLARPGRSDQQQAVAAGERDFQPAPGLRPGRAPRRGPGPLARLGRRRAPARPRLPARVPSTSSIRGGTTPGRARRRARTTSTAASSVSTPQTSTPSTSRASSTAAAATTTRCSPRRASAATIGRTPGTDRTSPPSDSSPISATPSPAGPDLFRSEQDPDRHRQIERRAGLAQVGRREVDRDPPRRMDETGVPECAAHALAGLLEGGVGQPDDGEPGQPGRDVDLDADQPAVEADEGGGRDDGQHTARLRVDAHPAVNRGLPRSVSGVRLQRADGLAWRTTPACRPSARTAGATRRAANRPW